METAESSKRRRLGCSDELMCIENVERNNDGGVDCKHKVFLCHSGEQKDFVEWMYKEIRSHDRSAFLDKSRDSLPLGCDFPREIFKAVEECEVGVVVLSKAFFTKAWWPMVEFARLAKRKEENEELVIILVLYDMELAECRRKETQREWIEKWETWAGSDKRIVIADWTRVFKLFGPVLSISRNKEGDGNRVIEEVVAEVCKRVTPETRGDDPDMQGRERICEFVWAKRRASEVSRKDGARVVGVYGVGGIGKSTMCRALCEKLRSEFGHRVCHAELATNSDEEKEKEVLIEMVKSLIGTRLGDVDGHNRMKLQNLLMNGLMKQKVFVALDNVGDGARTKGLARALLKARFAKDSFVVVTARSMWMLQDVGINEGDCHEMPELVYEEAKRLFLNNAPEGLDLEDSLVEKCVWVCYFSKGEGRRCHYHPLALKVLGGQLGSDPREWMLRLKGRDRFNALREKEHPIFSILRSSFDALMSEDQLLFMEVALFFPERKNRNFDFPKDVNILTWLRMIHGGTDGDLMLRLKALKRKSLIECIGDGTDRVGMHDLWREFCVTEITSGDGKDRFWFYRMDEMQGSIDECRFYDGGWENLRRVCLKRMQVRGVNFQLCVHLTVLKLVKLDVENQVVDVSPLVHLKSLEVQDYGRAPVDIQGLGLLRDLCILIWHGKPENSASIGEIAGLVHLEVLMLVKSCLFYGLNAEKSKLADLSDLCCLRFVTLRMGSLPRHLEWSRMVNLQYLDLSLSVGMVSCNGLENLVALVELNFEGCSDLEALPFLGRLTKLEKLEISGCEILTVLGVECLVALKEFKAVGCQRLKVLPNIQTLSKLEVLNLRYSLVERVVGLEGLTALQQLWVDFDMVKDYPSQPQLTEMKDLEIGSWGKEGLPCMVGWTNLVTLEICECGGVRKLEGLESLSSLQKLRISECNFLDVSIVSCLTSLQTLWICNCKNLEKVPSLDQLLKLELLWLEEVGSACWEGSGTVPQLETLHVKNVPLCCLPNLSNFLQLRRLYIEGCDSLISVTSDGPLAMLEHLCVSSCSRLESLPDLKGCTQLREFDIESCHSLKSVLEFSDPMPRFCKINGEDRLKRG